jgi:hypothetical protein
LDDMVRDLSALGRDLRLPEPSQGLSTAVMGRVATLPLPGTPTTSWGRASRRVGQRLTFAVGTRRRRVVAILLAVLLSLLAAPPVRAAVADWFGFGGVRVERGSPPPGKASPPPRVEQHRSLAQAAAAVSFPISMPRELGVPDGVEVSPDGRMVSMSWTAGRDGFVRLDQFAASLDFSVVKRTPNVQYAAVGGADALWFEEPHEVVLLEPDGTQRTESARLAGHTLIWLADETTLRLEGDLTLQRAVQIAESSVPVG